MTIMADAKPTDAARGNGLRLKVAEAMAKDAGHAYARMGPEDMAKLGTKVGDTVEIAGKRRTVCR